MSDTSHHVKGRATSASPHHEPGGSPRWCIAILKREARRELESQLEHLQRELRHLDEVRSREKRGQQKLRDEAVQLRAQHSAAVSELQARVRALEGNLADQATAAREAPTAAPSLSASGFISASKFSASLTPRPAATTRDAEASDGLSDAASS